jgi:hypothetical protein
MPNPPTVLRLLLNVTIEDHCFSDPAAEVFADCPEPPEGFDGLECFEAAWDGRLEGAAPVPIAQALAINGDTIPLDFSPEFPLLPPANAARGVAQSPCSSSASWPRPLALSPFDEAFSI